MSTTAMSSQDVYVMRVWHEASDASSWRVTITHTKSYEKIHFANLDKLVAFFKERLGEDLPEPFIKQEE
jgi:hypothetical protein